MRESGWGPTKRDYSTSTFPHATTVTCECKDGYDWIISSPVGEPLNPYTQPATRNGDMDAARVSSLMDQIQFMALAGAVHCDVRHSNMVINSADDKVMLIDHGATLPCGHSMRTKDYHGTSHTASSAVVDMMLTGHAGSCEATSFMDLQSAVQALYLMRHPTAFQGVADAFDAIDSHNWVALKAWWAAQSTCATPGWKHILKAAAGSYKGAPLESYAERLAVVRYLLSLEFSAVELEENESTAA